MHLIKVTPMTLWQLKGGDKATVTSYLPDLGENYRVRLSELGFHPGGEITCVLAPGLGAPKLYQVNNTVYSLDDNIATLIQVDQKAAV